MQKNALHPILWLVFPLVFFFVFLAMEVSISQQTLSVMLSENGPVELLQVAVIFPAFVVCVMTLLQMDRKNNLPLTIWVGIATLGSLYVSGEEISWGQHVFGWITPDNWSTINDQQETNLHNVSHWLDQKPRMILEIGVVIGGLIIPFLNQFKPDVLPEKFRIIYPPATISVTAALYLILKIADILNDAFGAHLFARISELLEFFLFYFVLLYMLDLKKRIT